MSRVCVCLLINMKNENSIENICNCLELYDGCEIDLGLTKDNLVYFS